MLSNKDFLGLLEGGGGKEKFDLKQVKQWDQQNYNEYQKKSNQSKKKAEKFDNFQDGENPKQAIPTYRDRAQERRLDANPDYDPQYDIAEKLDVEQSKYLGGDVEHTHLVKGLDYTLLNKIRREQEQEQEQEQGEGQVQVGGKVEQGPPGLKGIQRQSRVLADVRTQTSLGFNIKQVLRSAGQNKSSGNGLLGGRDTGISMSADVLQRTAFKYNVDILCDDELPTTVLRSQELASDLRSLYGLVPASGERAYVTPPALLQALTLALDSSSLDKKKGKKRKDASTVSTESSTALTTDTVVVVKEEVKPVVKQPTSIFDDLDADTTYTPTISAATSSSSSTTTHSAPTVPSTVKTYFGGHSDDGDDAGNSKDESSKIGDMSEEERMAPVLELLRAQKVREQRLQKGLQASGPSRAKMTVAEGVAHRDIFGGCDGGGNMVNGESMSGKSSYDVYPESGDFETYDSDTEEPETKKVSVGAGANGGTGGAKGKRSGKDKVKDKSEKVSKGANEGGMNRAQRRALGRASGEGGDGDRKRPKLA